MDTKPLTLYPHELLAAKAGRLEMVVRTMKPQPLSVMEAVSCFESITGDYRKILFGSKTCPDGYRSMRWFTFEAPWNGEISCLYNRTTPTPARVRRQEDIVRGGCWRNKVPRWTECEVSLLCPFPVGSSIYGRETWRIGSVDRNTVWYKDEAWMLLPDGAENIYGKFLGNKWHPAVQMKLELSRFRWQVVGVECRQIQTITEDEAKAAGIIEPAPAHGHWCDPKEGREGHWSYRKAFAHAFDSLVKPGQRWEANVWAWFVKVEAMK